MRKSAQALMAASIASLLTIAISGCVRYDVTEAHSRPCGVHEEDGWTPAQYGEVLQRRYGPYLINLSARASHVYQEPGLEISISGYSVPKDPGMPAILFGPATAFVEIGGKRVQALGAMHGAMFSNCEGVRSDPTDLNKCGQATLRFQTSEAITNAFKLHLGTVEIDGVSHKIQPIEFCYFPAEIRTVPVRFHM